jgi:hypothetical protein
MNPAHRKGGVHEFILPPTACKSRNLKDFLSCQRAQKIVIYKVKFQGP